VIREIINHYLLSPSNKPLKNVAGISAVLRDTEAI
jgi:hypothetical protein